MKLIASKNLEISIEPNFFNIWMFVRVRLNRTEICVLFHLNDFYEIRFEIEALKKFRLHSINQFLTNFVLKLNTVKYLEISIEYRIENNIIRLDSRGLLSKFLIILCFFNFFVCYFLKNIYFFILIFYFNLIAAFSLSL